MAGVMVVKKVILMEYLMVSKAEAMKAEMTAA